MGILYDARRDGYICLSHQTPLVRYLELPQTIRPLAVTPPLRILGMIASPSDLPALDIRVEQQRLERAIAPLQTKGLVQLHWLEGATWRDLQRTLRREQWHIFHFVGHGSFDPRRDEGLIAFCNDANQAHLLTAGDLGRLLADHRTLRLAVLNACLGAQGSNRDLFASTAATLVRRGILAVVAMQQAITDAAAIEFTQTFYESLADGLPVDAAVGEARKAISLAITNTLEWGTPVLYSRASDGMLFNVDALPAQEPAGREGSDNPPLVEREPSAHDANPGAATNLPGRGEENSQNKEPPVALFRKVDDVQLGTNETIAPASRWRQPSILASLLVVLFFLLGVFGFWPQLAALLGPEATGEPPGSPTVEPSITLASTGKVCDSLIFDIDTGEMNGISPLASPDEVKSAFPCFTGETTEGSDFNYKGGVFFRNHDFYFYTYYNFLDVRSSFKGSMIPRNILGVNLSSETKYLGEPDINADDSFYFARNFGCLVIKVRFGVIDQVQAHYSTCQDVQVIQPILRRFGANWPILSL